MMRSPKHLIFTYIHSANNPEETQALLDKKVIAIAYEDIETDDGKFPLLALMSEIAGEVGLIMGVYHMLTISGGSGILVGGAVGDEPANVAILGAGNVGLGAARYAIGLGADVTLLDIDLERLRDIRQKNSGLFLWPADRPNMASLTFDIIVAGGAGFDIHNPYHSGIIIKGGRRPIVTGREI